MATKLFSTKIRDESHAKLAEFQKAGQLSAECRVGPDPGEFSVWDGPEAPFTKPPEDVSIKDAQLDALVDRVAEKILARLEAKGAGVVP